MSRHDPGRPPSRGVPGVMAPSPQSPRAGAAPGRGPEVRLRPSGPHAGREPQTPPGVHGQLQSPTSRAVAAAWRHRRAAVGVEEQFAGVRVWPGMFTCRWWALVDGQLVEAESSTALRDAIVRARGGGYVRAW